VFSPQAPRTVAPSSSPSPRPTHLWLARRKLRQFLHFDRFHAPQFAAAGLLLAYFLQCVWLVRAQALHGIFPNPDQGLCIYQGLEQWEGGSIAGTAQAVRVDAATGLPVVDREGRLRVHEGYDQDRSPLYYLIAASPLLLQPDAWLPEFLRPFVIAAPNLFFGIMLGASLWYVSRRLYGNAGGFIALSLYCFSPAMIVNAAGAQSLGEMGAALGAFGTIFTAIAVAHTLYAPRDVVLWNWRRILLLGISMALAIGNQFSLGVLALVILPLMLWVAPVRPWAALAVWTAAVAVSALLLFAVYFFEPAVFRQGMLHARWFDFEPASLGVLASYQNFGQSITVGSPPLLLVLPAALSAYFVWKRCRYFGNTVPLLIAAFLLVLAVGTPSFAREGFNLTSLVFLLVFGSGMFADVLETPQRLFATASLCGLLGASAIWNLWMLWRV